MRAGRAGAIVAPKKKKRRVSHRGLCVHCLSKPLWSAALHFFKVLACAMDAKLATLGPVGSRRIDREKERDRKRDRQVLRECEKEDHKYLY